MAEFFRGWKRKLGIVALVAACVLSAGWVRSFEISDKYLVHTGETYFVFESSHGALGWQSLNQSPERLLGANWTGNNYHVSQHVGLNHVPYWSIVIPLIVLTIYLLFSKPLTQTCSVPPGNLRISGAIS